MNRIVLCACMLMGSVAIASSPSIPPVKLFHSSVKRVKADPSPSPSPSPAPAPEPQPTPNPNPNPPVPPPETVPFLNLPTQVVGDAGSFIKVAANTNGEHVRWVSLDKGLAVFPGEMLKDSTTTVVMSNMAGQYRLLAYTALNDIPTDPVMTMIVVNGPQPPPNPQPQPQPGPAPPPQPPVPPPHPTASKLFVVVVDNISTRDPRTTAIVTDRAFWNNLVGQGMFLNLNTTDGDAQQYKPMVQANGGVPAIIIMDGTKYVPGQKQALPWLNRDPNDLKLPTTEAGVQALINRYMGRS